VTGAERGDDEPVHPIREAFDGRAVIVQDHGDQADPLGLRGRRREDRAALAPVQQPDAAFDQVAQRTAVGRLEGGRAGAVRLADAVRGVDLVGQHHQAALLAGLRAGGDLHRRQQVGRPVGARQRRVAHRAGDDERMGCGVQEIQQVGGFLDGVRALGDHHSVHSVHAAAGQPEPDGIGQRGDVREGQRRTRYLPEVLDVDGDTGVGQAGHRGDELFGGQRGHHAAFACRHRDRAARAEDDHATAGLSG
jgi:hypothetical protein